MAVWQVQEAKTRLSEVIEEAISKGPQFITRHGSERAVILSVKDYRALTAHKPDLREVFGGGGPKVDRFEVPRSRDNGRKAHNVSGRLQYSGWTPTFYPKTPQETGR